MQGDKKKKANTHLPFHRAHAATMKSNNQQCEHVNDRSVKIKCITFCFKICLCKRLKKNVFLVSQA
jgi:hypothetical protein